ncbi:Hypothetical protein CINCED_3A004371 [Cinara cedri]|uniref:Uncharacterized protein n=1 Tax=Cinara cedri TaxID=506608 RepID=A0A5E4NCP1_9HEMI|nr:Hypothetical protein CINCED_3A004371 [Cinara cedri]
MGLYPDDNRFGRFATAAAADDSTAWTVFFPVFVWKENAENGEIELISTRGYYSVSVEISPKKRTNNKSVTVVATAASRAARAALYPVLNRNSAILLANGLAMYKIVMLSRHGDISLVNPRGTKSRLSKTWHYAL